MRRWSLVLVGLIFFAKAPVFAGDGEVKATVVFLQRLQTPSGGFLPAPDAPKPSLRATSSAVRTLHYLHGDVPNPAACVKFVENCFNPEAGGFADTPGGKVDLFTTAVGVMAIVELKLPKDRYGPPAVKYLTEHAKSFEDIRIVAAALEALGTTSARNQEWLKEIRKMQNADGTYGQGAGQVRATGGAVAAVLRLGGKVDDRDKVTQLLKRGQRKSGGYGKEDSGDASDLQTTYRVNRSLMMLKSRPDDVPVLEAFIAKCRNPDGGYGVTPGQPSTVSGTYYATIVRHWIRK